MILKFCEYHASRVLYFSIFLAFSCSFSSFLPIPTSSSLPSLLFLTPSSHGYSSLLTYFLSLSHLLILLFHHSPATSSSHSFLLFFPFLRISLLSCFPSFCSVPPFRPSPLSPLPSFGVDHLKRVKSLELGCQLPGLCYRYFHLLV